MDTAVAHQYGRPLFYRHGITLTKLTVVQTIAEGYEYSVFFAGSSKFTQMKTFEQTGRYRLKPARARRFNSQRIKTYLITDQGVIYKIVHWYDSVKQEVVSKVIDVWDDMDSEAIRAMTVSPDHRSLYVSGDVKVLQYSVASCRSHGTCSICVRDPFCVWSKESQQCQEIASISGECHWYRGCMCSDATVL